MLHAVPDIIIRAVGGTCKAAPQVADAPKLWRRSAARLNIVPAGGAATGHVAGHKAPLVYDLR